MLSTVPLVQQVSSAPYSAASGTTMLPTGIPSMKTKIPASSAGSAKFLIISAAVTGMISSLIARNAYIFASPRSSLRFAWAMDAPISIMDMGMAALPM